MDEELSTHELLINVKQGNMAAAAGLYARYKDSFLHYAKNRGIEDQGDIVQEFFIARILPGPNYDEARGKAAPSAGHAWIWRMFGNYIVDILRDKSRERNHGIIEVPLDDAYDDSIVEDNNIIYINGIPKEAVYQALACAQNSIAQEDLEIIVNPRKGGPSRGPLGRGREAALEAAIERLHVALLSCLEKLGFGVFRRWFVSNRAKTYRHS